MSEVHRWQYQYLGTSSFPKTLSAVELQAFFTFSEAELAAINSRYKAGLKIAAALQIGFLKMAGCPLDSVRVIPQKLLRHVTTQLGVTPISIASLRTLYKRAKTRYEHQWWAMELLGFSKAKPGQLKGLLPYLISEAKDVASVDVLVQRAQLWLYQRRFIMIGDRAIRDYARRAMTESEGALYRLIREQLPASEFSRWEAQVLASRPGTGRSTLEWLQQPPRRRSIHALRERMERIEFLKTLGVATLDLGAVAIEKLRAHASQLRAIRPVKYRELRDPARTVRLVCFLKLALMQASDAAILLASRQTSKLVRHAYERARLLEAESTVSQQEMVEKIFVMVDDPTLSDATFRKQIRALKAGHQGPRFRTRAAAARWLLSEPHPALRALLHELQKLDIETEAGDPNQERIDSLRTLYRRNALALPAEHDVPVPAPWNELLEGEDRERAMRALEAATLIGLRKALKSGAAYVDHSEKFRGRHRLLIDAQRWDRERTRRYAQLNLPLDADELIETLVSELDQKLRALDEAVTHGTLRVEGGAVRLPRLKKAAETRSAINAKRETLFSTIGTVQLPDLILDMDSRTGFSKVILGRPAKHELDLLQVYAGMLAHGSALDATSVALMVPQLTPSQIRAGMTRCEDRDRVRAANDAVTGFQRRIPIAAIWGDGSLASSDMMSLDVSRQIWVARLDPRRRIPSVGTYTHVSDVWSVIYDQPIILNERQAGAALEGAIRQTEVDIERLAVDTHGYTEFAMGIAKLLGFALCPRLARLAERKLYLPSNFKVVPESLADIVVPSISLAQIRKEWDGLVRLAASVDAGYTTATIALARFGTAASDSPLYRAGVHLGRLIRSLYLCDYFLSEDLRRTVNRILVHGEAVHTLQRAINAGTFSKPRGQHEDELYAVSGSLTLLTNLCLAWTTNKMQERLIGDGTLDEADEDLDWLANVSPAHFSNINFRGTFSFAVQQYREWLFSTKRANSA